MSGSMITALSNSYFEIQLLFVMVIIQATVAFYCVVSLVCDKKFDLDRLSETSYKLYCRTYNKKSGISWQ